MRKCFVLAGAVTLAALVCAPHAARSGGPGQTQPQQSKFRRSARPLAGRYVVMLDEDAVGPRGDNSRAPEVAAEVASRHGARVLRVFTRLGQGFAAEMPEAAAVALSRDPRVRFVEEEGEARAASARRQSLATQQDLTIDNNHISLWGLDRIDHHEPYLDWKYTYRRTGEGVYVYVFDTGIRTTHTQFGGRAAVFYDAFGGDGQDCNGHGTHVAGTVGGVTYGVAKGVWLRSVRVLNCQGVGAESDIIDALEAVTGYAIGNPPAIANMSFTLPASDAFDEFVQASMQDGLVVVAAAGDTNQDACDFSPGRVPGVHTIGSAARDYTETVAHRGDMRYIHPSAPDIASNYGRCVEMFAPGDGVMSAWYQSDTAGGLMTGSSSAAAHASGVAALELQGQLGVPPLFAIPQTPCRLYGPTLGANSPNAYLHARTATDYCGVSLSPWVGTVGGGNTMQFQPNCGGDAYYSTTTAGTHSATLIGPYPDANLNLTLLKYVKPPGSISGAWVAVADSSGPFSCEMINYSGGPGIYRWRISTVNGGSGWGDYSLEFSHPQ